MTVGRIPCAVIGYGSIGRRHERILKDQGCDVAVVSRRDIEVDFLYKRIADVVKDFEPEYAIVSNETFLHHNTISQLASSGYKGKVLVEKPLFTTAQEVPIHEFCEIRVAYNLRLHPVILRLREILVGQKILSMSCYVGKYLPDWRPNVDYRESYSAHSDKGGGVLLDLSHELDYLSWILGDCLQVAALGGHLSSLEVTSDDVFSLLLSYSNCPVVTVDLNYVDRRGRRTLVVNTENHTYEADLILHKLSVDLEEKIYDVGQDDTYKSMHRSFLMNDVNHLCSIKEGLSTLQLVDEARESARLGEWREFVCKHD